MSRARTATRSRSPNWALERATREGKHVLIVDTGRTPARRRGADGRAVRIRDAVKPQMPSCSWLMRGHAGQDG